MNDDGVAIVGMGCIFPGASDLGHFRDNLISGADAITDVPGTRWSPSFYDPNSREVDRFYCRRGGFIDEFATFDPIEYGIMPSAAEGAEPDQLLALRVASEALADAGHGVDGESHERTGVILGRGSYLGAGMVRAEQQVRGAQQLVECLRSLVPELGEERIAAVKQEFQSRFGPYGPDTAIGLVPNLAASRIANRLDLGGPAYTIDAACASSLVAVAQACRDLRDDVADMVIAGGVHLTDDLTFWSVFCQLGALSRSEQIRPFDRHADGLLIGEGIGLVVLRRLADAQRDGDRIYAVIRGCGISSDGRHNSLMAPRVEGQLLALERAWRAAGLDPATVDLVEAHGTGTPAGDAAELETLARFFGAPGRPADRAGLGSVKSMIGHAMPAAGAAALIKTALAMFHGFLPPTLHVEEPHEALAQTRFRTVDEAEAWDGKARRAGVNAFGFGGINAHVVLESDSDPVAVSHMRSSTGARAGATPLVFSAAGATIDSLQEQVAAGGGGSGPCRVAVLDPTEDRVAAARAAIERGKPVDGRGGVFFAPRSLGGKTALLFAGVEATFEPRVDDLISHFDLGTPRFLDADDVERRGAAVVEVGRLLHAVLDELEVRPDVIAGHSVGEWAAMIAAGVLVESYADAFLDGLRPGTLELPGFVFAALGCDVARARSSIEGLPNVHVSHDNCPHQTVISGPEGEVESALARLRAERVLGHVIPYPRGGFHTPLFADQAAHHRDLYAAIPFASARIPLWSATSCEPYPDEPDAIRELAVRHLTEPVRFRELVERLYDGGVRIFIQVGTGNLVGFVDDTLRGRPHRTIAMNVPQRTGLEQLRRAAAALFVEDVPLAIDKILPSRERAGRRANGSSMMTLALGVPLARLDPQPGLKTSMVAPLASADVSEPVAAQLDAVVQELFESNAAVTAALTDRASSEPSLPASLPGSSDREQIFSLDLFPELIDHSFLPQPPGWPDPADLQPIVPMTMSIATACEVAESLSPGSTAVAVESVRAFRWLEAYPPAAVRIKATHDGHARVRVELDGFFEATVVLGRALPEAPATAERKLEATRPFPITPEEFYGDGWTFHGPAYQGVRSLDALADNGLRGRIEALPAKGALLDAAGQLLGLWLAVTADVDRLALPVKIEKIEWFSPGTTLGETFDVDVAIRRAGKRELTGDIQIARGPSLAVRITGWQDWRFPVTPDLYRVMQHPDRELLAASHPSGFVVLDGTGRTDWASDWLAMRYLSRRERAELRALPEPRREGWLSGRIAAKDAVRHLLRQEGDASVFPVEVGVASNEQGRPIIVGPHADIQVSIAHKGAVAVALAARGASPGADLEFVEPRDEHFLARAFNPEEVRLVPAENRDAWIARFWTAKEALAKARGTGIVSGPKEISVTSRNGERLCVDGVWVDTRCEGERVIAWTSL